jgi:hypothetical protein
MHRGNQISWLEEKIWVREEELKDWVKTHLSLKPIK